MCTVYLLVLLVIGLKKAFATGAENHGLALIIRVASFPVWNHWLLSTHNSRAVAYITFQYFDFHLVHSFWRLNISLVKQAVKFMTFFPNHSPELQISLTKLIHKILEIFTSFDDLKCGIMILNALLDRFIALIGCISISCLVKIIKIILIFLPFFKSIEV